MKVYTTGQVAKALGMSPRTVSKLVDSGRLKGYRIPGPQGDRRIPRCNLVRFMISNNMPLEMIDTQRPRLLFVTGCSRTSQQVSAVKVDQESFSVCVASNGFEAAQVITAGTPPKFVMVDFTIGRSEAIQLVRFVRSVLSAESPDTRYIAIASEDEVELDSLSAPGLFDDVRMRPVDVETLVHEHLGGDES